MEKNRRYRRFVPFLALLLALVLVAQGVTGVALAQELGEVISLTDITEDPETFADEEVTLEDQVGVTFGRRAFALGEDDQEVLVITTSRQGFPRDVVRAGAQLRVIGEADVFEQEAFEAEFGRVNPRLVQRFEGRPFVVAVPTEVEAIETDVVVEPEVDVVVTPEAEVEVAPEADVVVTPEAEVDVETEAGVQVRPDIDVAAQPEVDVGVAPEVGVGVQPDVDVGVTPEVGVEVLPEVDVVATPEVDVEVQPELDVAVEPDVALAAEPEITTDVAETDVEAEAEAEVDVDVAEPIVEVVTEEADVEARARRVLVTDLVADPDAYLDRDVVVEDEIGRRFGRSAFTLGADDEQVLVISTERAGFDRELLEAGEPLRAAGRVDIFDLGTFEREFGIRVNPRVARQFVGQPFIAADPAELEAADDELGLGEGMGLGEDTGLLGEEEEIPVAGTPFEDRYEFSEEEDDPLDDTILEAPEELEDR